MKLELDIQTMQNQSSSHNSANENNNEDVKKLLRAGINSAKEGNRSEARLMLLQVTEAEPQNETAWLWLASISEYPEELLVFLQNVLKINPENERAIEWAKQTKALLSKTFVQRGIDASHQFQKDFAKQCFLQAIVHDEQNEMAWLWLASSTDSVEEKCSHLQKVLNINPENETALSSMKSVKHQIAQPFLKKAGSAAISGDHELARQNLDEAMKYSSDLEEAWVLKAFLASDFYEKIACYERALQINPEHDGAKAGLASLQALAPKVEAKGEVAPAPVEEKVETVEQEIETEVEENFVTDEVESTFNEQQFEIVNDEPQFEEAVAESDNILETPLVEEVTQEAQEPTELLSEVFDAPTGDLDEVFVQEAVASFSYSEAVAEESVAQETAVELEKEEVAESVQENECKVEELQETLTGDLQNEESSVAEDHAQIAQESVFEQSQLVKQFESEESAEIEAASEAQPVAEFETTQAVESVQEFNSDSQLEATDESTSEVVEETQNETFNSVATPDFQTENQVAKEYVEEDTQVEEAQQSFVQYPSYYQPEPQVEEAQSVEDTHTVVEESQVVVESQPATEPEYYSQSQFSAKEEPVIEESFQDETQNEVVETVTSEPQYDSSNGFGSYSQANVYTDYQQPTVEFSYQNIPAYTDPTADTITSYAPTETIAPQPSYFAEEEVKVEEVIEQQVEEENAPEIHQSFSHNENQFESVQCPFCHSENDHQAVTCASCEAMLSLSDLEMMLAHQNANQEVMLRAIEKMEVEKGIRAFEVAEITNLGIAHLNAHNLRKGFSYLQEASQLNPNDVVLSSKVNFLAIRLNEIEEYDQKAQENPVQSKTIMVVDDSPTVRKLITGKLEKCGHSVVSAVDGMDALAKINEVIPDLVLLDITMPRLDGYQVCKLIRNNEITKDIPVVMISGKDGFFDKVRGRMAGSSGYITKPFGPDTLMKTIETYLA